MVEAALRRVRGQGRRGHLPRLRQQHRRPSLHGPVHPGGRPRDVRDRRPCGEGHPHRGHRLRPPEPGPAELPRRQAGGALQPHGRARHRHRPPGRRRAPAPGVRGAGRCVQPRLPVLFLRIRVRRERVHARGESVQPARRGGLQEEHVRPPRKAWL